MEELVRVLLQGEEEVGPVESWRRGQRVEENLAIYEGEEVGGEGEDLEEG